MSVEQPIPASVLDEIERLERAATPGPWADGGGSFSDFGREWPGSLSMEFISNGGAEDDDIAAHAPDRKEADAALIVAMRNALREIIRLARVGMKAEGSGWKTIDSAPKDGTLIDLFGARNGYPRRFPDAKWAEIRMMGSGGPTGHFRWFFPDWDHYGDFSFTHWMPIPASPEPGDPS